MIETTLPTVSVILPVRNEANFIQRALDSVLAQDYPRERIEVIVADGMSIDGTRAVVQRAGARHPHVRWVENPGLSAAAGLNAGLRAAVGEIVVRVDGHCEIAPDYVRRCVGHLLSGAADGVGGPIETVGETPTAQAIALAMSSRFGVGNSAFRVRRTGNAYVDTVAFPAYRRSLIDRGGPFDEELIRNQDDEYNSRLRKLGAKILLADDVRSRYFSRSSFRSLWRQYFQYGYWKVRVMQKHPRQIRPRQLVPPLFTAGMLASLAAVPIEAIGWRALASLAGLYGTAVAVAATAAAGRSHWRLIPRLCLAFPILHLSYGLGFLAGLVRFWNRWGPDRQRTGPRKASAADAA